MPLMKSLRKRSKTSPYYVVLNIPPEARHLFEGKKQVWRSTRSRNEIEAMGIGAPWIVEMKTRIAAAKAEVTGTTNSTEAAALVPKRRETVDPELVFSALARWRTAEVERHYIGAFNGSLPRARISQESLDQVRLLRTLEARQFVPFFAQRFADALTSQGVAMGQGHPALSLKPLRDEFYKRWTEVEQRRFEFIGGEFDSWRSVREEFLQQASSVPLPVVMPVVTPSPAKAPTTTSGMKLVDLFDRWVVSKSIDDTRRQRGYVTRLSEFLGDPDLSGVTSARLDEFKVALRRFPNTKRRLEEVPFLQVVEMFEAEEASAPAERRPTFRRLASKTIWNWFRTYNAMLQYAVDTEIVARNPAASVMPVLEKKPTVPRLTYDPADIAAIFARPLFQGCDAPRAYRKSVGAVLQKDAFYWLPVFCLWQGCRVEEVGAAMAADIKQEAGHWFLDLRHRTLKNEQSQRMLPLHPRIVGLGFIDYAQRQPPGGRLFPELPHDERPVLPKGAKRLASTRQFSKWWGRWCRANAPTTGQGFDHPHKVFHSFRHTFKRSIRGAGVSEEMSDLLTGHKGNDHAGRSYGQGVGLAVLANEIAKLTYPTFPDLP